jgi:hypothetical protein
MHYTAYLRLPEFVISHLTSTAPQMGLYGMSEKLPRVVRRIDYLRLSAIGAALAVGFLAG